MSIAQTLLPEFDQEMSVTRRVLERVPDEHFGWKPHEKSFSLAQLASHVANLPTWVNVALTTDTFDGMTAPRRDPASDRVALLARFDANAKAARAAIEAANDSTWMGSWTFLVGGKAAFSMPRVAVHRGFVMNHSIHHRGQLSVYLRLLNVPVPSIYGPSADENPFG